jgi:nitrogen fixation NifU-like protein
MSEDVRDLYQQVILDHDKRPRNFRSIGDARRAEGHNPLCGDRLTVYVRIEDGVIRDVSFEGSGCAISRASASLMTETIKGRTLAEADALHQQLHAMMTAAPDAPVADLGPLTALSGVRQFPVRVKCATLAWHTLRAAADSHGAVVSTE